MQLHRIVVGVDFSESSLAAALWTARHLASDAELVLVDSIVIPEPPGFLKRRLPAREPIIEAARAAAEARLREFAESLPARQVRWEVGTGDPAERIEQVARERRADLIVIGKHGARGGSWRGLGTTAERLSQSSTIPILLAIGTRDAKPIRLLVAVDDDDVTEWVLAWARGLAERFGARVTLINVVSPAVVTHVLSMAAITGTGQIDERAIQEEFREDADRWLSRLAAAAAGIDRADYLTAAGNPAEKILAAADRVDADLIVVGSRQLGLIRRTVLGSTASEILHRAIRPVLVVKRPADGPPLTTHTA